MFISLPKCLALVGALSLSSFTMVSAQTKHKHIPPEMEYQEDPYRPLPPVYSAGKTSVHGAYTSVQVNVDNLGRNIVGDAANEPSLVLNPANLNQMSIGWRQFNNRSSNFRQAGFAYSTNGGQTWTFPGLLQNNVFRSDPVLDVDPNGKFLYLSLQQSFFDDLYGSTNGGQSYSLIGPADGGDKEWLVVDRTNSTGRGFIYQLWSTAGNNYGGRQFSRSTNGGSSWMNPINLPRAPIWGTLDVSSNGDLYVGGGDDAGSSIYWLDKSLNAKNGSVTPTFDAGTQVNLGGSNVWNPPVNPAGLGGQAYVAVDKSGGSTNNNVYMLSSVSVNGSNPSDVHFVRSTNGGQTFSSPIRINDDSLNTNRYHWMAAMALAPNGRIDVTWFDTRADSTNTFSALYYSYSTDGGLTWAQNIQLSQPFNHFLGYPNQDKIGDYMGLVSDNSGPNVAYAATFNGEEDVYFLHANLGSPITLLPNAFSLFRGILISGGLTELASSDDQYLVVRPGFTLNAGEAPVQIILSSTSSIASPSAFQFAEESHVSISGLSQKIALFNFVTQQFEEVDSRAATTTDSSATVNAGGTLSRLVDQGNGEVRTRLSYLAAGPIFTYPWFTYVDQASWTLAP